MHVTVEEEKRVAAGQWVLLALEVFDQREEDGVVVLPDGTPVADHHDAVREAVTVCPAAAIHLTDS